MRTEGSAAAGGEPKGKNRGENGNKSGEVKFLRNIFCMYVLKKLKGIDAQGKKQFLLLLLF